MDITLRQHLDTRLGTLNNEWNESWRSHYKDLNDYVSPRAARFVTSDRNRGDKRNQRILNETATFSVETGQRGMMYGVTNPSRPWLRLKTPNPKLNKLQEVREWLDNTATRILEVFLRSNLYSVLPNVYEDLWIFGTSAVGINKDPKSIVRFEHFPVGSYRLAAGADGRVDTIFREFQMTRRDVVQRFGVENCTEELQQAYKNNNASLDEWIDIVHAVEPNGEHIPGSPWSSDMPYHSVYYEKGADDGRFLEEKGLMSFRVLTPRWKVRGMDVYGESPMMQILGTVKGLQKLENRHLMLLEKVINPPIVAPTSMKNKALNQLPGAVTFHDSTAGSESLKPLMQIGQAPLEAAQAMIAIYVQRIRRALFEDVFLMLANDQRSNITAEEIRARMEEKVQTLGPILLRLNDELLDPLVTTTFEMMADPDFEGLLLPPPPALKGAPLNVEYVSDMARAMKLAGISAIESTVSYIGNLAVLQANLKMQPTAMDKINIDEAVDMYAELRGTPATLLYDQDAVKPVRDQRNQSLQEQAQAQQQMLQAKTLKDLATAPADDDSVLTRMGGAA